MLRCSYLSQYSAYNSRRQFSLAAVIGEDNGLVLFSHFEVTTLATLYLLKSTRNKKLSHLTRGYRARYLTPPPAVLVGNFCRGP